MNEVYKMLRCAFIVHWTNHYSIFSSISQGHGCDKITSSPEEFSWTCRVRYIYEQLSVRVRYIQFYNWITTHTCTCIYLSVLILLLRENMCMHDHHMSPMVICTCITTACPLWEYVHASPPHVHYENMYMHHHRMSPMRMCTYMTTVYPLW